MGCDLNTKACPSKWRNEAKKREFQVDGGASVKVKRWKQAWFPSGTTRRMLWLMLQILDGCSTTPGQKVGLAVKGHQIKLRS